MSAIARYYRRKGLEVSGYDRTSSDLTKALESEGIPVHYEDDPSRIPPREGTMVVYTPAVPNDMSELLFVKENGYKVVKRSAILGEITRGERCLAVAGTHGKTTTSTMAAHFLTSSGEGVSAFLGGISKNYGSNLIVGSSNTVVVEADEFDRSFLQLFPEAAVITAMDPDHLDIYGTPEAYEQGFRDFAAQVSGSLIIHEGLPLGARDTKAKLYTYNIEGVTADYRAEGVHSDPYGHFIFDLIHPGGVIRDFRVGVPGRFNAENALAAAALCLVYGADPEEIKKAADTFSGVVRRLDIHLNDGRTVYIDDYAHHPEELASAIRSIRGIFPGKKITAVFQPHLYTRTRDFAEGFAKALGSVDKLILLDIYPAREEPIPGVSSKMILEKTCAPEKILIHKEDLLDYLADEPLEVLVTFGAGNIDRYIGPITELLKNRK